MKLQNNFHVLRLEFVFNFKGSSSTASSISISLSIPKLNYLSDFWPWRSSRTFCAEHPRGCTVEYDFLCRRRSVIVSTSVLPRTGGLLPGWRQSTCKLSNEIFNPNFKRGRELSRAKQKKIVESAWVSTIITLF